MLHAVLTSPDAGHSLKGGLIVLLASVNAAWAQDAVSLVGVVVLGVAFVWVQLDERLRRARRDRRLADAEADAALRRVAEAAGRDDLTAQLTALQARADEQAAEGAEDRGRMRQSLHTIKDDLHVARLENAQLRDALAVSDRSCAALASALADANRRTAEALAAAVIAAPAAAPKGGAG